jgi:hypothetical protein
MKQSKHSSDKPVMQSVPKLKLRRNHGRITNGRDCKFYVVGTEFDLIEDAELIASLVQSGAQLDE